MSAKASKGRFLKPDKLQNHTNEGKKKTKKKGEKETARRKKGGEEKKAMVTLLVFILATLKIASFGDNIVKNRLEDYTK